MNYILGDDGSVKPIQNLTEWALFMERARESGQAVVGDSKMMDENGEEVRVSTVFLGLDHSFGEGEPQVFELMIFGGRNAGYQRRFSTFKEATAWHLLVTRSTLWEIQASKESAIVESAKPWKRNLIV